MEASTKNKIKIGIYKYLINREEGIPDSTSKLTINILVEDIKIHCSDLVSSLRDEMIEHFLTQCLEAIEAEQMFMGDTVEESTIAEDILSSNQDYEPEHFEANDDPFDEEVERCPDCGEDLENGTCTTDGCPENPNFEEECYYCGGILSGTECQDETCPESPYYEDSFEDEEDYE